MFYRENYYDFYYHYIGCSMNAVKMHFIFIDILCHSHLCTEQVINISALSKLREIAEISAVRYKNLKVIIQLISYKRYLECTLVQ